MTLNARIAFLLFACAALWPAFVEANDEVNHGATSEQVSEAHWWNIPYPARFDSTRLVREQSPVRVRGKDFVTGDGETIVLRGVNIADPGKLSYQGRWNRRLFEEVADWGANVIRLPIHPMSWRKNGSDWYFERIDEAMAWANELGMYLIIDWHSIGNLITGQFQHPMYETSLVETTHFWRQIAWRYKGVPTLAIAELFNEPTNDFIGTGQGSLGSLDWPTWRDTMEELIDVIRPYDPSLIFLVGGLNWAYDLSPVGDMPVRRDNVAYAAHAYPQKARPAQDTKEAFFEAWQRDWGYVAESWPVVASEIGWVREDGYNPHVPVIHNEGTYGPRIVEFMDQRGISWTVWNFDTDWGPIMISDWDFTPTEQGEFFRKVMRGE